MMRGQRDNVPRVLEAIRARGTRNFTGAEIGDEAGICRQTVYKIVAKLRDQGHRIEGEPRLGFMARLGEENHQPLH
jgi:biotin operon repressor